MIIKNIGIFIEFENGNIHQVATSKQNKLMALETISILNDGVLPVNEKKETIEFEDSNKN